MATPLSPRRLPALVLGLSVAGFAAAACGIPPTSASTVSAPPLRCELILSEARGATTIEGRVSAERPVAGTYRLSISSSSSGGRAMINQSGDFEARPGAPAILGQTTLGGPSGQYRADLELTVPGQRLTCNERSGARDL